jgi:LL-diaminopimelate aminotransferase
LEPSSWRNLPDYEANAALCNAARKFWNVPDSADILAVPGCSSAIAQIPSLQPASLVEIATRTYNEHAAAFLFHGWDTHARLASPQARVVVHPNNPTGATISKDELGKWVNYARKNKSLILFDAAYEAFIRDKDIPHSIYEIDGAKEVAVEFRSFSKTAGFTGTRCAFTVVPRQCMAYDSQGAAQSLHALWNRRHSTKFNGVSYPVQRAAEAIYSDAGKQQVNKIIAGYMKNADRIRQEMDEIGLSYVGGENSPYIWIDAKGDSWDFFDTLLNNAGVVCTPGAGFGTCGDQYIRLSAFNSFENVEKAMNRIRKSLK